MYFIKIPEKKFQGFIHYFSNMLQSFFVKEENKFWNNNRLISIEKFGKLKLFVVFLWFYGNVLFDLKRISVCRRSLSLISKAK